MVDEVEFLTVPEAATVLGYTPQHTRFLIRQGKLHGTKRGRDWVIPRESVIDYNVRKASIPLLPSQSKRGRPSTAQKQNNSHYATTGGGQHR